jgi:hypothetical protein
VEEVRKYFEGCRCHSTLSAGEVPFLESPLNGSEEVKRKERGSTELMEKRQGTAYRYTYQHFGLADWQGATPHAVI